MDRVNGDSRTKARLSDREEDLRRRLEEAEQTLEAIRRGEVDAIVVTGSQGDLVYSLTGVEHAYRVIVETMNEAALTTDLDGTILFCNQRFCDLMRTPMHEVLGRNVSNFAAEAQQPVLKTIMAQAQAEAVREHLSLRAADGTAVPVLLSAGLLRTTESVSLCLVASDLTELEESANSVRVLRESRQALQESEERYRRFFMDDLTGDFIATPEGAILECNPAFAEIYGFESPAQAVAEGNVSRFNPQDWCKLLAEVRRQGKVRLYEGRHARPDGRTIYVIANVRGRFNDTGELVGLQGYVFDDTERKLAELALQETNARLEDQQENLLAANEQLLAQQEELHRQAREVADANVMLTELKEQAELAAAEMEWLARVPRESPHPVFRISLNHHILYRNDAADGLCRLWACGAGLPQAVRDLISAAWNAREAITREFTWSDRTYLLTVAPFVADGYVNLYGQDITDRRKAAEAVAESEDRYHRLFEDDLTGNFISTPEGQILLCNPSFARILGFSSAHEAVGTSMLDLYIEPGDRASLLEMLKQQGRLERLEVWRKRRTGEPIYVVENVIGRFNDRGELEEIKGYIFDDTDRKRAEEALRESEERFRALVTTGSEVLYRMSPDWSEMRQLHSRGFLSNTDRPNPAWLDQYIPADDQPEVMAAIEHAIRTKSVFELEHRVRQADGSLGWTLSRAVPLMDARGEIVEWFGAAADVTSRKHAEEALRESEEQYRRLFNSIDEGFCIIEVLFNDADRPVDYRFIEVNPAFESQTGLSDARGKSMRELAPGHESHWYETYGRIATTGEPARFVNEAKALHRWYDVYAFRVDVPEKRRVAVLFNDITEQRRAEESLRDFAKMLETRVAERTQELEFRAGQLQKLALELSQAEELERRRLAEILHDDLQQQLAAVKFHLGILSGRMKEDFGGQKSVGQLDKMIKDAIETSRSLSHELSPAVMYHGDLGEILEWLANQIRTKHGLLVEVDARGRVDVESEALKTFLYKAVQEMLFNAVKHAKVSRARIRVRRRGRYLCVCVSDYGRGFDPQELKKTAGFGLISIRERVELLGGRMKIHSVKDAGSRFILTVPDGEMMEAREPRTEDAGQRTEASSPASADRVLQVLIADDHEIVRHGLAALLSEAEDVELVGQSGNGREAVDLAYQLRPDVVILDVAMPLMNGDEAARQIRRHLPGTRIVALSMYEEAGTAEKMRRAGAEAYLLKTAPADELLAAVRGRK